MNPTLIAIVKKFINDPVVKDTAHALLMSIIREKFENPHYMNSNKATPQITKTL